MRHRRRVVVVRMSEELEYDPVLAWMLVCLYAAWTFLIFVIVMGLAQ